MLAIVLFGRIPSHNRWASDLSNAAHGPAFALVTLVVFALLRRSSQQKFSIVGEYSLAILITILLGALIELLQHFTGRDAALVDLGTDALGALAVAGVFLVFDSRVRESPTLVAPRRIGFVVAVVACILMLAPLVTTATAYLKRYLSFPTLADFSLPLSTSFLHAGVSATVERAELPRELQSDERASIGVRAHLTEKTGWVVVLSEPVPDWRGYTHLNFDIANSTDEPLVLRLRVFDQFYGRGRHSGYRGSFEIAPHSRAIQSVALTALNSGTGEARTDTSRVHSIVIARAGANRAREFYLMRIWLD